MSAEAESKARSDKAFALLVELIDVRARAINSQHAWAWSEAEEFLRDADTARIKQELEELME